MLFDIPIIADMETVRLKRQQIVDERARLANRSRVFHDYAVNDRVLLRATNPDKLELRTSPHPFRITQVHSNGTVTIQRGPHVTTFVVLFHFVNKKWDAGLQAFPFLSRSNSLGPTRER